MHSRTLQVVMGLCLLMSIGVFINTLALQDRQPAAVQAHADGRSRNDSRPVPPPPARHEDKNETAQAATPQPSRRLVRAIQRELKERKYYGGHLDGILGLHTRAAIMDYEAEHRQALTGAANELLLRTILLGTSLTTAPSDSTQISDQAQIVVHHVQMLLKQTGFGKVRATGKLDAPTLAAIGKFERHHQLPPKRRITYHLLLKLESVARTKTNRQHAAAK